MVPIGQINQFAEGHRIRTPCVCELVRWRLESSCLQSQRIKFNRSNPSSLNRLGMTYKNDPDRDHIPPTGNLNKRRFPVLQQHRAGQTERLV